MRFADPQYLWLLLLVPGLALGALWVRARRRKALLQFAGGPALLPRFTAEVSSHRRSVRLLLTAIGLAGLTLALARPQWGTRLETVTRRGADVVLVLDTSLSMATEDLAPSRLEQARHAAKRLLDRLGGDRVALVTFAGDATLSCPLTVDEAAVRLFLDSVDVQSVASPGSDLAAALDTALAALGTVEREPGSGERGRAIVLFSDGEDHEGHLDTVLPELRSAGVVVHAVGTGSARGAPIPLRDARGQLTEYKKDGEGRVVTSRLDESFLERIALETGGRYYRATATEVEVDEIARAMSALDAGEAGAVLRTRYEERFQIPLVFGFTALLAECLVGDRRRQRRGKRREPAEAV